MGAALALQKAIRARLVATPAVIALVPAASILDRNQRPAPSPSIILGEAQQVDEGNAIGRNRVRIYHAVHVWKQEPSLTGATAITSEIRKAFGAVRLQLDPGFHCADQRVADIRVMRDPDGETSHGVVTIEALILEVAT
ncbi:MAG: DUF3168 domain-containing protein [Pararhodobacter sp.]|nr:DUF3168 domain-containing protein [Pararhodobacter sp.]